MHLASLRSEQESDPGGYNSKGLKHNNSADYEFEFDGRAVPKNYHDYEEYYDEDDEEGEEEEGESENSPPQHHRKH